MNNRESLKQSMHIKSGTNEKLIERGVHMVMEKLSINNYEIAKALLLKHGSVKKAIDSQAQEK